MPLSPEILLVLETHCSFPEHSGRSYRKYVHNSYPQMQIIACVYEPGSVDFCQSIHVDAFKLHSADLSNPYLVKYVAATGKRIDLSVGASTLDEIETALEWIRAISSAPIWLMFGYQNFPTRIDDVHLRYLAKLKQLFELPVGYQDHSDADTESAFWLPAAAVGMGVTILEKHITHDRSCKGIDHQAALNPDEFARFVTMVREIESALGVSVPKPFSLMNRSIDGIQKRAWWLPEICLPEPSSLITICSSCARLN